MKGLQPFTSYAVHVLAYTLVGEGPTNQDAPTIKTPEDGSSL